MPRLYVVDTNVVVSGVLRFGHECAPAVVLDRMLDGRLPFLLSTALLAEYRLVLGRPQLVSRHGLGGHDLDALMAALTMAGYLRQPEDDAWSAEDGPAPPCPDGDEHIMRLLAREAGSALVSGDRRLLDAVRGWRPALAPADVVG